MLNRRTLSNVGIYVYGVSAIVLGITGLLWGDFATNWQRVPASVPHREALAYITAIYEIVAGIAILWRRFGQRTAQVGAAMLALLYSVFTLLWVARVFVTPRAYDPWGNVFEELALVIAAKVIYVSLAPPGSVWAGKGALISKLYGVCAISFALNHFANLAGTASFVPKWIPPGQMFWAVATAVFFLLAAAAILSGVLAGLAAYLLTAMILGFELLLWLPMLIAHPHVHFICAANAINFALIGATWVVADSLQRAKNREIAY